VGVELRTVADQLWLRPPNHGVNTYKPTGDLSAALSTQSRSTSSWDRKN